MDFLSPIPAHSGAASRRSQAEAVPVRVQTLPPETRETLEKTGHVPVRVVENLPPEESRNAPNPQSARRITVETPEGQRLTVYAQPSLTRALDSGAEAILSTRTAQASQKARDIQNLLQLELRQSVAPLPAATAPAQTGRETADRIAVQNGPPSFIEPQRAAQGQESALRLRLVPLSSGGISFQTPEIQPVAPPFPAPGHVLQAAGPGNNASVRMSAPLLTLPRQTITLSGPPNLANFRLPDFRLPHFLLPDFRLLGAGLQGTQGGAGIPTRTETFFAPGGGPANADLLRSGGSMLLKAGGQTGLSLLSGAGRQTPLTAPFQINRPVSFEPESRQTGFQASSSFSALHAGQRMEGGALLLNGQAASPSFQIAGRHTDGSLIVKPLNALTSVPGPFQTGISVSAGGDHYIAVTAAEGAFGAGIASLPGQIISGQVMHDPAAPPQAAHTGPLMALPAGGWTLSGTESLWPDLDQALQTLGRFQPEAAQSLRGMIPAPHSAQMPAQMPAAVLFLLSALGGDKFSKWFGEQNAETLRRLGQTTLLRRLATEFGRAGQQIRAESPPAGEGGWRIVPLPLWGDEGIQPARLAYRHTEDDSGGPDQDSEKRNRKTRFIFDTHLSRMGFLQIDGLAMPGRLDTWLRTEKPLSQDMQQVMRRAYRHALRGTEYEGTLDFQAGPDKMIAIQPSREAETQGKNRQA